MPLLDVSHSSPQPDSNQTQLLPGDSDVATRSFWSRLRAPSQWPRSTQLGLAATGGALAVASVSLAVGVLVGSVEAPRQFFDPSELMPRAGGSLQVVARKVPASSATTPNIKLDAVPVDPATPITQAADVDPNERLNPEGTGLAALQPQSQDDQRRLQLRREEDRILREKRALEDKKRAIEREIEAKQLEANRQQETRQMMEAREAEDKKRLEDRLAEDHRLLEERQQAEKQDVEAQQQALDAQEQKLAEANP